jgi:hypothetical protein
MTTQERTFDLLEASKLNWSVNQKQLIATDGAPTGSVGLFRSDSGIWLNTVTKSYQPVQNAELAEMVIQAGTELGIQNYRGGFLSDGKKIYIQGELPDEYIGRSSVKRWLTSLNRHGSGAVGTGSSNTVVVCQNTFHKAWGEIEAKFRHSSTVVQRLKIFMEKLTQSIKQDEKLMRNFKVMADIPMRDEPIAKIFKKIAGIEMGGQWGDLKTHQERKFNDLSNAVAQEVKDEGATLWALFNSVTRYTNHIAKTKDRESYLMTGAGFELSNWTYATIMQYIAEHEKGYDEVLVEAVN